MDFKILIGLLLAFFIIMFLFIWFARKASKNLGPGKKIYEMNEKELKRFRRGFGR